MQSPSNENAEKKRPIGRFLLDYEPTVCFEAKEMYMYAAKFAQEYSDIINPRWRASRVSAEELNGRHIEIEFSVIDAARNNTFVWSVSTKGEQYDVYSTERDCRAEHYTFTAQGALMRKETLRDNESLASLKSFIEYMTDTYAFHKNASAIRGDSTRTYITIQELEQAKSIMQLTHKDEKNLQSLRSHLFLAGFPVGSRDVSRLVPLIQ